MDLRSGLPRVSGADPFAEESKGGSLALWFAGLEKFSQQCGGQAG